MSSIRIPLKVESLIGSPKPVLYTTIHIPQFHVFKPLKMFVDTGSSWTMISPKDTLLLQIPISKIRERKTSYGVGGAPVIGYAIKNAVFAFRNEERKLVYKVASLIYASQTEKRDREIMERVLTFPSILGVEFLMEHKYKLVFDPFNSIAYLEESVL